MFVYKSSIVYSKHHSCQFEDIFGVFFSKPDGFGVRLITIKETGVQPRVGLKLVLGIIGRLEIGNSVDNGKVMMDRVTL